MRKHLKKLKHVRLHTKRRSVEAHTLHRRRKDTSLSFALCPHPTVNAFLFAVIFFAVAAALILGAKPKLFPQEGLTPVAITNSNGEKIVFYAEIADNDTERIQGLSDREKIAENRGMFFVFEDEAVAGFWMVKMKFPIDMIFFDRSMKIGDIVENTAFIEENVRVARLKQQEATHEFESRQEGTKNQWKESEGGRNIHRGQKT